MPRAPVAPERPLEAALVGLRQALDPTGVPWMIIGGIAVIGRGVRRLTTDIDVAVRGDAITVDQLMDVLERHGFQARIPDARRFASVHLVLLLRHVESGVDIDLSLACSGFEHEGLASRTAGHFGQVEVPMATPEALVVYKAIAGRPRDLQDLEALLSLHSIDLVRTRVTVRALAEIAEAPELLQAFDVAVERLHARSKS